MLGYFNRKYGRRDPNLRILNQEDSESEIASELISLFNQHKYLSKSDSAVYLGLCRYEGGRKVPDVDRIHEPFKRLLKAKIIWLSADFRKRHREMGSRPNDWKFQIR